MNITCSCGGRVVERVHSVKTKAGASQYGVSQYPIDVEVSQCNACGRAETKIYLLTGEEIKQWENNETLF